MVLEKDESESEKYKILIFFSNLNAKSVVLLTIRPVLETFICIISLKNITI